MKMTLVVLGLLAIATLGAVAVSAGPDENATYGLCNAWAHNEKGREKGDVENAPPFVWLQEQAEEAEEDSVEAYCSHVPHPGHKGGNGGGRP